MSIGVRKSGRRFTASGTRSNDGHPEYQEDTKWYELVEGVDRELLYGSRGKPKAGGEVPTMSEMVRCQFISSTSGILNDLFQKASSGA
jgi:hypothetical protein